MRSAAPTTARSVLSRPGGLSRPRARAKLLLRLAVPLCAFLPSPADPVRIQDLELLLAGGVGENVILGHVRRWGIERDLTAADLVALKAAGGSDSLLEDLAGEITEPAGEHRLVPLSGGQGMLLTNLDARGRRLGGEAPEPASVSRLEAPQPEEPDREPVLVQNFFLPGAPAAPADEEEFGWGEERVGYRLGTPGGYTRYKLYYSRAPYDGFRTWVPPVAYVARVPVLLPPASPWWGAAFPPPFTFY